MGVIGALMAAKTAAAKENDDYIPDVSGSSDIVDNMTCYQHSIKLLELVADSTSDSNEAFALFCDELSLIMLQKKIGKTVLEWVGDRILGEFEENYIVDVNPSDYEESNIRPRFALDEVNEPVALNLYEIVLKNESKFKQNDRKESVIEGKQKKIDLANESRILSSLIKVAPDNEEKENLISPVKLSSIFRLLRIYKHIQDGNLDAIDALLGCSIILPELRLLKMNSLSVSEQHLMLNTLFYCVNWIRENINAFASSDDVDIKCNVLTRLQLLVELEELICIYINQVYDYTPPIANFDCEDVHFNVLKLPSKNKAKRTVKDKTKKSKKLKVDNNDTETTNLNGSKSPKTDESEDEDFEIKNKTDPSLVKKLLPYFREFDFEVFSLLKSNITFRERVDVFSNEKVKSVQIHSIEVKFLLEDLLLKLHQSFGLSILSFKISPRKGGFSNLESLGTEKIFSYCIEIIPSLCCILESCATYFKNLNEDGDVSDSLLLFTKDSRCIMDCINLVLKVMHQIISWKNLNSNENITLLKNILSLFSQRLDGSAETTTLNELISQTVNYFNLFTNNVPSLLCAANLMQLLTSLMNFSDDNETKNKISHIALKFLKKIWPELKIKHPKTALINENVKILLDAYLTSSKDVLKSLEYLAAEAIPQITSEDSDKVFNTLNKASLICYYKMMFKRLSDYTKVNFIKKQKDDDKISQWSIALKIFQVLTNLIKTFGGRLYVATCLKYSRDFMATFLKYGMPVMDKLFAANKDDVICLMKTLQVSTRYLQHVCSHSKVVKDVSLISHVPFLKKSLEVFVFRVKVMLAVHKCEEAFWLGNLKNRDIKGAEILSQSQEVTDEESDTQENNEEEIVESKSDADVSGIESEGE